MFGFLALLFIVTPVLELWLLLEVGGAIGAPATIAVVVGTGAAGAWLARREGLKALQQWMDLSARGVLPGQAIFAAMAIFLGGALLLTPGIITDVLGLMLLLPPTRAVIQRVVLARLKRRLRMHQVIVRPPANVESDGDGVVIDQSFDDRSSS